MRTVPGRQAPARKPATTIAMAAGRRTGRGYRRARARAGRPRGALGPLARRAPPCRHPVRLRWHVVAGGRRPGGRRAPRRRRRRAPWSPGPLRPGPAALRAPFDVDKGTVVAELAAGLAAVCFLGDDVGDVPAFRAPIRLAGDGVDVAKIVVSSSELATEVLELADVVVDGPIGALAVLRL